MDGPRPFECSLFDDMADIVDNAVAHGGYSSSDDVINEALAEWHQRRIETPEDFARLRQSIQEGLNSGDGGEVTDEWFEDIKRRGRERLASAHRAA